MTGNEWHFGLKAHIGIDSWLKIAHSFASTPADVHRAICCRNYWMVAKHASGAMQPIEERRR